MKNLSIIIFLLLSINIVTAQNGNFVETNGVKIYYETYGEGEPLLLLHGFTLSGKSWEPWIEDLSKNNKLIIPDLRGHGNSTNPSKMFTHKMSAIDMYGLMDSLEIDKFKAIGQSSGAMTLIHMATMNTSRISRLVLVSGTTFFPESCREVQRSVTYENQDPDWMSMLMKLHPKGEMQIRSLLTQFKNMADTYDDMNFTDPYLKTISCPTFIIHGDRDPFFPVEIPFSIYKAVPNSYLWIVPNDGHIPVGIYDRKSIWSDILYKSLNEFFEGKWDS